VALNDGSAHASIDISTNLGIGFLPFFSKQGGAECFFNKVLAFLPRRPSVDTTKGEKSRRCSRRGSRYFFFFSRSWAANACANLAFYCLQ
jgi:hypothetical protein